MWSRSRVDIGFEGLEIRMLRMRQADLGDRGHLHAQQRARAEHMVYAAYLMATHSNGIPTLQLQNLQGLRPHNATWLFCAMLRRAIVGQEVGSGT